mmetsp:Transcript_6673/g.10387  ORF Transcript_6673/g.10387 Transcript_6673/m.10387 type:complete len:94 (-) Transcript_6673:1968-2249(-)
MIVVTEGIAQGLGNGGIAQDLGNGGIVQDLGKDTEADTVVPGQGRVNANATDLAHQKDTVFDIMIETRMTLRIVFNGRGGLIHHPLRDLADKK